MSCYRFIFSRSCPLSSLHPSSRLSPLSQLPPLASAELGSLSPITPTNLSLLPPPNQLLSLSHSLIKHRSSADLADQAAAAAAQAQADQTRIYDAVEEESFAPRHAHLYVCALLLPSFLRSEENPRRKSENAHPRTNRRTGSPQTRTSTRTQR